MNFRTQTKLDSLREKNIQLAGELDEARGKMESLTKKLHSAETAAAARSEMLRDTVASAKSLAETTARREALETVLEALEIRGYGKFFEFAIGAKGGRKEHYDTERFWDDLNTALEVRRERKAAEARDETEARVRSIVHPDYEAKVTEAQKAGIKVSPTISATDLDEKVKLAKAWKIGTQPFAPESNRFSLGAESINALSKAINDALDARDKEVFDKPDNVTDIESAKKAKKKGGKK